MALQSKDILDRPLTHHDLEHTPDDGSMYEVIDGVLYVTPFPTYSHQEANGQLFRIVDTHVRSHGLGKVFHSGLKVVLDEPTGVGPDIVYISSSRMDGMREDGFHGAPDLLVEVHSSRPERDRFVKAPKYARSGVPHYWIVDPSQRTLVAYRLEAEHYRLSAEVGGEASYEPELFPGLLIELRHLWI